MPMLVTGGAGFIGGAFVAHHRAHHPADPIVVLDLLTYAADSARLEGIADISFVHGDIADEPLVTRLLADHALDTIVNFAAETHVDRSIASPAAFIATNIAGTHALLEAARAVWLSGSGRPHRFHQVSTDEVFGALGPDDAPCTAATPFAPNSPYAASKAAADHLVRAWARTYGLQTSTTHGANSFGPGQYPEKLIPLTLTRALAGHPIPIYGDGRQIRDWLHVADHARAIALTLAHAPPGTTHVVGGAAERTNMAVVKTLCAAIDRAFAATPALAARFPAAPPAHGRATASLITHVADRPGHDRRYACDNRAITAALGFTPTPGVEAMLEAVVHAHLAT